jgi:MFS family permease
VPTYFEGVLGFTASQSGLALLPLMVCTTIGAVTAGRVMSRIGRHYKIVPLVGLALSAASLLEIFFQPHDLSVATLEFLLAIVATGVGAVFPVTTVSVQNAVAVHELGTATALITFMRNLGAAAGVAAFGTIVIGAGSYIAAASDPHGTAPDTSELALIFRWIFLAGAVGFGLAFAILTQMEERPLAGRGKQRNT